MNIEHFINHPTTLKLGLTLLHSLWQLTLIAGGLGVALRLLRSRSPQARYVLSCAALVAMIACPLTTFTFIDVGPTGWVSWTGWNEAANILNHDNALELPADDLTTHPLSANTPNTGVLPTDLAALNFQDGTTNLETNVAVSPPLAPSVAFEWTRLIPYLTAAWLFGVACLSLQLIRSFISVRRLTSRGVHTLPQSTLNIAQAVALEMRLDRAVRYLESTAVLTPTVVGHIAPVILLPASALTGLNSDQLRAILAHELAHIHRHDYLINLAQCLIETLLFYHPAAWYASNRIRLERELCCDDIALGTCHEPSVYAKALLLLAEAATNINPPLAPAATGSNLLLRVQRILNLHPTTRSSRPHSDIASTLPTALLATLLLGATFVVAVTCATAAQPPLNDAAKLLNARKQIIARHQQLTAHLDITYHETIQYTPNLDITLAQRLIADGLNINHGSVEKQNRFSILNNQVRIEQQLTPAEEKRQRNLIATHKNLEAHSSILNVYRPNQQTTLYFDMVKEGYGGRIQNRDPQDAALAQTVPNTVDWPQILSDPLNTRHIVKEETEADQAIRERLSRKPPINFNNETFSINFNNETFSNAIRRLRDTTNVNFFVNWGALEAAGVNQNTPLTLMMDPVPASFALRMILSQLSNNQITIDYRITDGVVTISTPELIAQSIERDNIGRGLIAETEIDQAVRKKLDISVPVDYDSDPIYSVFKQLINYTSVEFSVDWDALEKVGVEQGTIVTLKLDKVPASTALRLILNQVVNDRDTLDFAIVNGQVLITTTQAIKQRIDFITYDKRDLLVRYNTFIDAGLGLRSTNGAYWLSADAWDTIDLNLQDDGKIVGRLELPDQHAEQWTWDPELGYAVISVERFRDGKRYHQITADQFQNINGLMLPMRIQHQASSLITNHTPLSGTIQIDQYKLNNPANNQDLYQIQWPEGAEVQDLTEPKSKLETNQKEASNTTPTTPTTPSKFTFEDTLQIPLPTNTPQGRTLLDLDTGQFITPPNAIRPGQNFNWPDWRRTNGVDLQISNNNQTLTFYGVKMTLTNDDLASIQADTLEINLKALKPQAETQFHLDSNDTFTFLIDTREGAQGMMRITQRPNTIAHIEFKKIKNASQRIVFVPDPTGKKRSSWGGLFYPKEQFGKHPHYYMIPSMVQNDSVPVRFNGERDFKLFELGMGEADNLRVKMWIKEPNNTRHDFELDHGQFKRFTIDGRVYNVGYSDRYGRKTDPGVRNTIGIFITHNSGAPTTPLDPADPSDSQGERAHWLVGEWVHGNNDERHTIYYSNNRYRSFSNNGPPVEEGNWAFKETTFPVKSDPRGPGDTKSPDGLISVPYLEHHPDGSNAPSPPYYLNEKLNAKHINAFNFVLRNASSNPIAMRRRGVSISIPPLPKTKPKTPPTPPAPPITPHKKAGLEWDQLDVDLDLTNIERATVAEFFDKIPVNEGALNEKQTQSLKYAFTEITHAYGHEDMGSLLFYLKMAGQGITAEKFRDAERILRGRGDVEDYRTGDGWRVLNQMALVVEKKSRWKGLSLGGGTQIEMFTHKGDPAAVPAPGKSIQKRRMYQYGITPSTTSPTTPNDEFEKHQKVLIAHITLFVKHTEESGGRIQPYVLRHWYDSANDVWRPMGLTYFPDKDETFNGTIAPLF